MSIRIPLLALGAAAVALGLSTSPGPLAAGQKAPAKGRAWTLPEAVQQLRLYPRDPYLQYVALQLARRAGRLEEVSFQVRSIVLGDAFDQGPAEPGNERATQVDLFNLFSGALAVQESLQLDAMSGRPRARRRAQRFGEKADKGAPRTPLPAIPARRATQWFGEKADKGAPPQKVEESVKVPVVSLTGPTVRSHPWQKMLAGRKPDVGRLSRCVPEDFYLVEFRSLAKLLEVMGQIDLWGTHQLQQSAQEARAQLIGERLLAQLALEVTDPLRSFYDDAVEEVAVTGSDLYLREGSDVTLLFQLKQPEAFKARADGFLAGAQKGGARRSEGDHLGVAYSHLATPGREVHVYSAYPRPDLHVRSNSLVGLRRVVEAVQCKARRLGDSDEFAYIRTLMPRRAAVEDGLVYLSDPFIRRLVGPGLKLTHLRRLVCYNHLRMIGHAAMLYRTEHGKPATSLEELVKSGCLMPEFGKGELACPEGGKYSLSSDGLAGTCSHHGPAHALRPCCEVPVGEVTRAEADEYKGFLDEYNQYWRTFFDPIALRVQATPKRYRVETIVLPLIDNSIYSAMATALGGQPEPLDALPVPRRNILSVAVRLDKDAVLRSMGMEELLKEAKEDPKAGRKEPEGDSFRMANQLWRIGLAMHNYHAMMGHLPTAVSFDKAGQRTGLSWRVHLLPYLEQDALYREFKLDEPWDSPHNKKLITKMPPLYRPANPRLAAAGKTRFVTPIGDEMIFPKSNRKIGLTDVTDGTSNTILLVEVDDEHAVVWTRPDDLEVDLKKPTAGLAVRSPGVFLTLAADGSVRLLRDSILPTRLAALFTRAGGEAVSLGPRDEAPPSSFAHSVVPPEVLVRLKVGDLLTRGLGNQVGLHMYDAEPIFDFSLPSALGLAMGSFNDRRPAGGAAELLIVAVVASLSAPVYASLPVRDPKVVDEFLARLDELLAGLAREVRIDGGRLTITQEFYHFPSARAKGIRSYAFRFGPLKWRLHWGRVVGGLYVASKPFIFEDLLAAEKEKADPGPVAHSMVRLRPKNWDRVRDDYQLSWAEGHREGCLHNLGPLSSLARALGVKGGEAEAELLRLSARLYGVRFFCPEEGRYVVSPDGKTVTCSVHGSATAPRQPAIPSGKSAAGRLLHGLQDMTFALTFQEDGLHAVVTIDRK